MFNFLWTLLLGIIGGIISSVIVSRVFMIQGEYQEQIKKVESIIRKLGIISGYLVASRIVFEVSYDTDTRMKKEMEEKGYKSEKEYYEAHSDAKWISEEYILKTFKSQLLKIVEATKEEILNSNVDNTKLCALLMDVNKYMQDISTTKELSFSVINKFEKTDKKLMDEYDECKRVSSKQFVQLVLKDKVMIILYIIVGLLIIFTILTYLFGL